MKKHVLSRHRSRLDARLDLCTWQRIQKRTLRLRDWCLPRPPTMSYQNQNLTCGVLSQT